MRQIRFLAILCLALIPAVGHAQIKPESSGAQSFDEPEMRRHHHGLILPNEPGRPRVGYHRHHRRHRNRHHAY